MLLMQIFPWIWATDRGADSAGNVLFYPPDAWRGGGIRHGAFLRALGYVSMS